MIYREGERRGIWYRTDRVFRVGSEWFIATREEGDIGPFKSRVAAERFVPRFVAMIKKKQNADSATRKRALRELWASFD